MRFIELVQFIQHWLGNIRVASPLVASHAEWLPPVLLAVEALGSFSVDEDEVLFVDVGFDPEECLHSLESWERVPCELLPVQHQNLKGIENSNVTSTAEVTLTLHNLQ